MMTIHESQPSAVRGKSQGTMLAMIQERYGEAESVLRLASIAIPEPGVDEVLVRVHAAGVDRGVWHLTAGLPYPVRLAGYGIRRPKHAVPGMDLAGTVESVGSAVTRFRVGDTVFGQGDGTFAQYSVAKAARLAPMPRGLSAIQAAATPISASTALQAVRDQAKVSAGENVLVIGASGGVGHFATQLAIASGATVTAICGTAKADFVASLGADHVLAHETTTIADAARISGRPFDSIIDTGGHASLHVLRNALTPNGRLVIVGSETGGRLLGGTDRQLRAMALSPFVGQKLGSFVSGVNAADLLALSEFLETGKLVPAVDRTFELDEASAALRYLLDGKARGKVVVTIP
jgi:NADPH:quinone reductase-like Zn-dependent oxidoreductase